MDDAEKIYHQTGVPLCPLFLCNFSVLCFIPCCFLPNCTEEYCSSRRKSRLEKLFKDFNQKHEDKGISLIYGLRVPGEKSYGLIVQMNVLKREEYCAKNGITFKMPETIPSLQQTVPQPNLVKRSWGWWLLSRGSRSNFSSVGGGSPEGYNEAFLGHEWW